MSVEIASQSQGPFFTGMATEKIGLIITIAIIPTFAALSL
jgi:hypothetical protein